MKQVVTVCHIKNRMQKSINVQWFQNCQRLPNTTNFIFCQQNVTCKDKTKLKYPKVNNENHRCLPMMDCWVNLILLVLSQRPQFLFAIIVTESCSLSRQELQQMVKRCISGTLLPISKGWSDLKCCCKYIDQTASPLFSACTAPIGVTMLWLLWVTVTTLWQQGDLCWLKGSDQIGLLYVFRIAFTASL